MTETELFDTPALAVREPPPGGLDRVRATLDAEPSPLRRWLIAVPIAAIAAVVLGIVLALAPNPRLASSVRAPSLIADPHVGSAAFYWVATNRGPREPSPPMLDGAGQPPPLLSP